MDFEKEDDDHHHEPASPCDVDAACHAAKGLAFVPVGCAVPIEEGEVVTAKYKSRPNGEPPLGWLALAALAHRGAHEAECSCRAQT
mmetsp:Transcript_23680/g.80899  ORF Transcript_23680/g.80899 Transcript_23680/m.80899 type:complete len:86 (+) Transcript_23680:88-345(+)